MPIKGILFDKDGTLLDYEKTWMPVNRCVIEHAAQGDAQLADELWTLAGYDHDVGKVRSGSPLAAWTNSEIESLLISHLGEAAPKDLMGSIDRFSETFAGQSVLVSGCLDTLKDLKEAGLVLGIATNDSEASMRTSLAPHGVLELMDFSAGFDSGFIPKPAPDVIHGFCAACKIEPGEVAMVGDNAHDIETGKNATAGLSVGVLTGTSSFAELAAISDLVLESIAELPGHDALQ